MRNCRPVLNQTKLTMHVKRLYLSLHTFPMRTVRQPLFIHPVSLPSKVCERGLLKLESTYRIPLRRSNEWLFITPNNEVFTVLCGSDKFQFTLQNRGKLYLPPRCKGYSTPSTLYALSTIEQFQRGHFALGISGLGLLLD